MEARDSYNTKQVPYHLNHILGLNLLFLPFGHKALYSHSTDKQVESTEKVEFVPEDKGVSGGRGWPLLGWV